jgi:SAM-dependent methyltransferase
MNFYEGNAEKIFERLLAAHDSTKAIIRNQCFEAEYKFFRKYIRCQRILVCGSGLGHDSFELAGFNRQVVGIELLPELVQYSAQQPKMKSSKNVLFFQGDLLRLHLNLQVSLAGCFDAALMNMGTICNFSQTEQMVIIQNVLKLAKVFYFNFYPPTKESLKTRLKMYAEEYWGKLWLDGTTIFSEDGLYSKSYTKKHFRDLAKELGFQIKFHNLLHFVIMAEVTAPNK